MKKVVVDYGKCIRSGQCYYESPHLFERQEDYTPRVAKDHVEGDDQQAAEYAVDVCPSGAISVVEVDEVVAEMRGE